MADSLLLLSIQRLGLEELELRTMAVKTGSPLMLAFLRTPLLLQSFRLVTTSFAVILPAFFDHQTGEKHGNCYFLLSEIRSSIYLFQATWFMPYPEMEDVKNPW